MNIPASPWLFPEQRKKPIQKKGVENIDTAWSTTKLSDLELGLTGGDDNWCDKHTDWSGDCTSYVAFCAKVQPSPHKYDDANEKLCWTDCKSYIDFLKTVPSHFQGDAFDWCKKTEDDRTAWYAAPENNLPEHYPCHNLSDWRNFLIFIPLYNAKNDPDLPSDASKWFDWDILSNEYRKSLIDAYNKYIEVWNDYNPDGVNRPKCVKVDDIDSYIKCLLSPTAYPCQDYESWHNFSNYSDYEALFQMWGEATTEDKIKALRSYYDFQKTANGKICTDCSPVNAYITSSFPCKDCVDT